MIINLDLCTLEIASGWFYKFEAGQGLFVTPFLSNPSSLNRWTNFNELRNKVMPVRMYAVVSGTD